MYLKRRNERGFVKVISIQRFASLQTLKFWQFPKNSKNIVHVSKLEATCVNAVWVTFSLLLSRSNISLRRSKAEFLKQEFMKDIGKTRKLCWGIPGRCQICLGTWKVHYALRVTRLEVPALQVTRFELHTFEFRYFELHAFEHEVFRVTRFLRLALLNCLCAFFWVLRF